MNIVHGRIMFGGCSVLRYPHWGRYKVRKNRVAIQGLDIALSTDYRTTPWISLVVPSGSFQPCPWVSMPSRSWFNLGSCGFSMSTFSMLIWHLSSGNKDSVWRKISFTLGCLKTVRNYTPKGQFINRDTDDKGIYMMRNHQCWLVFSTPLKNIGQLGWLFPIYGKIKAMFQTTTHQCQSTMSTSKSSHLRWQTISLPCLHGLFASHNSSPAGTATNMAYIYIDTYIYIYMKNSWEFYILYTYYSI